VLAPYFAVLRTSWKGNATGTFSDFLTQLPAMFSRIKSQLNAKATLSL
jgi:hypothetical protein